MEIAGVIILTVPTQTMYVLDHLNEMEGVTTYGVYKTNHIVGVFEGKTPGDLEKISNRITDLIPGVLGVFPAYVNSDEGVESI